MYDVESAADAAQTSQRDAGVNCHTIRWYSLARLRRLLKLLDFPT